MTRIAPLLLLLPTLSTGCIIYDGTCGPKGDCHWWDDDTADRDDQGLEGDTGEVLEASFTLTPNEIEGGTVAILALTAENFDLTTITEVEIFGEVALVAAANRGDELLLTVSADDAAVDGSADLLLHIGDDVEFLEGILTVHAAPDDGSGTDSGGGGGSDTGSDCG